MKNSVSGISDTVNFAAGIVSVLSNSIDGICTERNLPFLYFPCQLAICSFLSMLTDIFNSLSSRRISFQIIFAAFISCGISENLLSVIFNTPAAVTPSAAIFPICQSAFMELSLITASGALVELNSSEPDNVKLPFNAVLLTGRGR